MNHTNYNIETPESIELTSIRMRKSGYGNYYVNVEFIKNNIRQFKSVSTNDSMLYDEFYSEEEPSWFENPHQAAFDLFVESL